MDETGIREANYTYWQKQAEIAVANFHRRRLRAVYVPDRNAAREKVLSLIPPGATIGRGDSMSVDQIGVMDILKQSGDHVVFDPFDRNEDGSLKLTGEALRDLQRKAMVADVFLSGANAVTLDGKVVATDSHGGRVAAMIFGPKKIIIVAGVNKLVPDVEAAFRRIREIAAPMNFWHHATYHRRQSWFELPCLKGGKCVDCTHFERGCNFTIVIESSRGTTPGQSDEDEHRHNIILVGESLGF
ncbi:MAG: lactate utilization protein [Chloroflexi bacterium]|nr:lactate utilization protein [Chloroflexota bacterium]